MFWSIQASDVHCCTPILLTNTALLGSLARGIRSRIDSERGHRSSYRCLRRVVCGVLVTLPRVFLPLKMLFSPETVIFVRQRSAPKGVDADRRDVFGRRLLQSVKYPKPNFRQRPTNSPNPREAVPITRTRTTPTTPYTTSLAALLSQQIHKKRYMYRLRSPPPLTHFRAYIVPPSNTEKKHRQTGAASASSTETTKGLGDDKK